MWPIAFSELHTWIGVGVNPHRSDIVDMLNIVLLSRYSAIDALVTKPGVALTSESPPFRHVHIAHRMRASIDECQCGEQGQCSVHIVDIESVHDGIQCCECVTCVRRVHMCV